MTKESFALLKIVRVRTAGQRACLQGLFGDSSYDNKFCQCTNFVAIHPAFVPTRAGFYIS